MAFGPLGWEAAWFSEIEPFPCAVLNHHYPSVPNHGDMTTIAERILSGEVEAPDLICGGTPCQAFSVAGLRNSLDDDRGNLTLQFIKICDANDAVRRASGREESWILYENVPGLLSTHDNAFGAFLGGLCGGNSAIVAPSGWGNSGVVHGPTRTVAYRILNAEHFGLAQRRKRVFVLAKGGAGRWAAADALLPIIESSRWHSAPSRSKGEGVTGKAAGSSGVGVEGVDYENNPVWAGEPMGPLMKGSPTGGGRPLPVVMPFVQNQREEVREQDVAGALSAEPGTHQTTYVAFDPAQVTSKTNRSNPQPGDPCHTLHSHEPPMLVRMREGKEGGGKGPLVSNDQSLTLATANDQVLAYAIQERAVSENVNAGPQGKGWQEDVAFTMEARQHPQSVATSMQVRRLTPMECERLQGFPLIAERLILNLCTDHQSGSVTVGLQCLRWQCSASHVGGSGLTPFASNAAVGSSTNPASHAPLAVLHVLPHSGGETAQLHSLVKCSTDASGVNGYEWCHRHTLPADSAQSLAPLLRDLARLVRSGKAVSQVGMQRSTPVPNGGGPAPTHGGAIEGDVEGAESVHNSATFTTSDLGQLSQTSDLREATLCCSVLAAIAGFIPSETLPANYSLELTVGTPYTDIPWRGKPNSPDGPRYKALGNSWAVPVVRYIGQQIKRVSP